MEKNKLIVLICVCLVLISSAILILVVEEVPKEKIEVNENYPTSINLAIKEGRFEEVEKYIERVNYLEANENPLS